MSEPDAGKAEDSGTSVNALTTANASKRSTGPKVSTNGTKDQGEVTMGANTEKQISHAPDVNVIETVVDTETEGKQTMVLKDQSIKVYHKRWIILALFVAYSAANSMQWIQFAIINNIVSQYYNISSELVNWTSLIYMVTYIPLVFPGSWLLNKWGLRKSCLIGAAGTCIGAWIKVAGVHPDRFAVAFVGQTIVAISQAFVLHVPARLASVWFGSSQVSMACAIGVFGNQLGVAIGFVVPPSMVKNHDEINLVTRDLRYLFYAVSIFSSVVLILMITAFKAAPPTPPSRVNANQKPYETNFPLSMKKLMSNRDFVMLVLAYGLLVGVFYALSTLLNQIILTYYPGKEEDAGKIGLTMVIAGMFGSVICGYILDKTRRYKMVTLGLYLLSLTSLIIYMFTLDLEIISIVYISSALLGFFMTGYLPVGFEYAAELTYPEPEGNSSGILNASAQVFGILLTILYGNILTKYGDFYANATMGVALVIGTMFTVFTRENLRRQRVIRGRRGP